MPMVNINNSNRKYLVLFAVIAIIFITAVTAIVYWSYLESTSNKLKQLADQYQTKTELVMTMWEITRTREEIIQNMLISNDPFDLDELHMQHMSLAGQFIKIRRQLLAMKLGVEEKKSLDDLDDAASNRAPFQDRIKLLILQEELDKAILLSREPAYNYAREAMFSQFKTIFNYYSGNIRNTLQEANNTALDGIQFILRLMALVLLFSALVGYFMIRNVARAEDKLNAEAVRRIATQNKLKEHQRQLEEDVRKAVEKYKTTEASRNESQRIAAIFGEILESSLNEIYIFDAKSLMFTQVNEGARVNLGYSMAELKKMTPLDLKPDVSEREFKARLAPLLDGTKDKVVFTTEHERKDGSLYPVDIHLQLSYMGTEAVFVAMVIDISYRLEWEEKLQKKKDEAEKVTQELAFQKIALEEHAIVCVIDESEIIQSINRKYVDISKYSEDELVGSHFLIGLSGEQIDENIVELSAAIHRGDIWHGVISFSCKDGEPYWTKTTITPFYNKDAEIYKFVVVSTDITEQKKTEEQLLLSNIEIEKTHKELDESHHMMLHSEKLASVGQLAAGIAHEINTPIQFVGDNTRFLQDAFSDMMSLVHVYEEMGNAAKEGKELQHLIARVQVLSEEVEVDYLAEEVPNAISQSLDGVERISKIVRSMKDFSHPGTDNLENIDINNAIESTINVSRNEWKYIAEMKTEFDKSLTSVPCYPGEFNQVILNMIVNAAHAIEDSCDEGDPMGCITISTQLDGNHVEICIADTGSGMPIEVRKRIFEPFFTTKGVGKGTGQGLAIAYAVIVDKHKGKICVDSEPGEGSTFIIHLPMKTTADFSENDMAEEMMIKTGTI